MIKRKGLIWFLSLLINTGFAQLSQEEGEILEEARASFDAEDYLMTWKLLEPISHIHVQHAEMNYLMGASAFELNVYREESHKYLSKAHDLGFKQAFLPYARFLLLEDLPEDAMRVLNEIEEDGLIKGDLELVKAYVSNAIKSKQTVNQSQIESLEIINSDYADHTPLISFNDSVLLFTSRKPLNDKSVRDFNDEYDENIFITTKSNDGWSAPQPLPGDVNGMLNDATVAMRPNGSELLFFQTNKDLESSDIWLAKKKDDVWKKSKKFSAPINSEAQENSVTVNLNGDVFFISSNRPGGYGGFDLYRVVRFGNGDLSEPINLGPAINGPMDEVAPFLLPDDKTLYYSSNGPSSIGGFDFYKAIQINDSLWTKAENLGRPICTTGDDVHLSVSWSGGMAYFARPKSNNIGDQDIFMANLPGFNVRANVYRIKINNFQETEGAEVIMFSDDFSETVGIYNPTESGEIVVALLPGESGILEIAGANFNVFEAELRFKDCVGVVEKTIEVTLELN